MAAHVLDSSPESGDVSQLKLQSSAEQRSSAPRYSEMYPLDDVRPIISASDPTLRHQRMHASRAGNIYQARKSVVPPGSAFKFLDVANPEVPMSGEPNDMPAIVKMAQYSEIHDMELARLLREIAKEGGGWDGLSEMLGCFAVKQIPSHVCQLKYISSGVKGDKLQSTRHTLQLSAGDILSPTSENKFYGSTMVDLNGSAML